MEQIEPKIDELKNNKEKAVENKEFMEALRRTFKILDESGLDWRLVGGLALDAFSEEPIETRRANGTLRDVDMLILNDEPEELDRVRKALETETAEHEKKCGSSTHPQISFSFVRNEEYANERRKIIELPQILTHILLKDGEYYLQFRDIEERVAPEVFQSYNIAMPTDAGPVTAKTLSPETLIHLYLTRTGYLKQKDVQKIKNFLENRRESGDETSDHNLYLPFHRFAKDIRNKYRIFSRALAAYNYIDHRVFRSALTQRLIPRNILKALIDI